MAAKKVKRGFIALYSECGDDSQLKTVGGDDAYVNVRDSIEAAKTDASDHAEGVREDNELPNEYVIVEVVVRGKASGLVWK